MNDNWTRQLSTLRYFAIAVVIIGLVFKTLLWPLANMLLVLGLGSLACIFALSTFFFADVQMTRMLLGWGAATNVSGVLFSLLHWPGAIELLIVGVVMWVGVLLALRAPTAEEPTLYDTFRNDLLLLGAWGLVRIALYFIR